MSKDDNVKAVKLDTYKIELTYSEGMFIAALLDEEARSRRLTIAEAAWRQALSDKIHPGNPTNRG